MTRDELLAFVNGRLVGYDLDGVMADGFLPLADDGVIISGRRTHEWHRTVAQVGVYRPIYLRAGGVDNDVESAGRWKAEMCRRLSIEVFFEDNQRQIALIQLGSPTTTVFRVTNAAKQQCHRVLP